MNLIILLLIALNITICQAKETTPEILREFLPNLSTEEHRKSIKKKGSANFLLDKFHDICDHYQLPYNSLSNPFHSEETTADRTFQDWSPTIAQWNLTNGSTVIFLAENHASDKEAEWLQKKIDTTEVDIRIYENAPLFSFLPTTSKRPIYQASRATAKKIYYQFKHTIPFLKKYNRDYDDLCGPDETETLYRIIIEEPKLAEKWDAQLESLNTIAKDNSISADPTDEEMIDICKKIGINGYDVLNLRSQFYTDERKLSNLLNKMGIQEDNLPEDYDTNILYKMIVEKLIHYIRDGFMLTALYKKIKGSTEPKTIVIQRGSYHLGNSWKGLEHVLGKGTITFCPLFHVTSAPQKLREKEITSSSPKVCGCIIQIVYFIQKTSEQEMPKLIQLFDTNILSGLTPASLNHFKEALDNEAHKELKHELEELKRLL